MSDETSTGTTRMWVVFWLWMGIIIVGPAMMIVTSLTGQNWQSGFLTVGAMVAFAIHLRQRGSGESKPVVLPHHVSAQESE